MKPTKRAIALLTSAFTMHTKAGLVRCGSAVDTCQGTMPLWGQLVRCGLVEPNGRMPTLLGHPFSYRITKAGETAVDAALSTPEAVA